MQPYLPGSKFFRILSLDGGGIRGIIPGQILATLEDKLRARTGNPESRLVDYFDLVAGTGAGGMMACAYLAPVKPSLQMTRFTAAQVVDLFVKFGEKVFNDTLDHRILTMGGLLDEKYNATTLERILKDYFEDLQLSHLLKPSLIASYDITKRAAHFFTSHTADKPADDYYLRDVARATSAMPTLFECERIQSLSGVSYPLIDGAIVANNPAMCAYAEVHNVFPEGFTGPKPVHPTGMVLLSLGTGIAPTQYDYDEAKNWGLARWTRPLLDMTAAASVETVHFQLQQLFTAAGVKKQYLRLNPRLTVDIKSDKDEADADNVLALKELGAYVAETQEDKIDAFIELLVA